MTGFPDTDPDDTSDPDETHGRLQRELVASLGEVAAWLGQLVPALQAAGQQMSHAVRLISQSQALLPEPDEPGGVVWSGDGWRVQLVDGAVAIYGDTEQDRPRLLAAVAAAEYAAAVRPRQPGPIKGLSADLVIVDEAAGVVRGPLR